MWHLLLIFLQVLSLQTVELQVGDLVTSELPPDAIGLLINVSPQSLGPTTTPELSKIIEETQVKLHVDLVYMYIPM